MGDDNLNTTQRRLLVIIRALMFATGAALGWFIMWQIFETYPDIVAVGGLRVMYEAVTSIALALGLLFLARPVFSLCRAVGGGLKNLINTHSGEEIAGSVTGILFGLMITFFADALLSLVLFIIALRVLLDIAIAFICCFTCAYACSKWVAARDEELKPPKDIERVYSGYILTYEAFLDDALIKAGKWLVNLFVLSYTVDRLIASVDTEAGYNALKRYTLLREDGKIKLINPRSFGGEIEEIIRAAKSKRLKIITFDKEIDAGGIAVLDLKNL